MLCLGELLLILFLLLLLILFSLALLLEHAQWEIDERRDGRSAEAARRFARAGVDALGAIDPDAARGSALAMDEPLSI